MNRSRLERELERHHADAWGWALSCCRWNPDHAEDVLSEAYLRVLEGRASFRGRSAFRTWLFGVIRRVSVEQHRSEARHGGSPPDERYLDVTACPQPLPDASAEAADLSSRLREALTALPERQREVLHLVFYEGLTIAEAADVMGVSLGTGRTHYERGKDRLRKELAEP